MSPEKLYGSRFIKAGAKGYLSKEAPVEELRKALDAAMSGQRYMSQELMNTLVAEASVVIIGC